MKRLGISSYKDAQNKIRREDKSGLTITAIIPAEYGVPLLILILH